MGSSSLWLGIRESVTEVSPDARLWDWVGGGEKHMPKGTYEKDKGLQVVTCLAWPGCLGELWDGPAGRRGWKSHLNEWGP